jgi:endonuclease YncB( thermonuclease family)
MGNCSSIKNYNYDNTSEFSLNNIITIARIVDIYDGDSCTCIIKLNKKYNRFIIRLAGIDTPEITSKNTKNKETALGARKRLCSLISDDFNNLDVNIKRKELRKLLNSKCYLIIIKCGKFDKYGRLLAYLYNEKCKNLIEENSFNKCLVNEKLAYIYNGGTKLSEDDQEKI